MNKKILTFIHKGINGRWRETLSAEQISQYDQRALTQTEEECASWSAAGDMQK